MPTTTIEANYRVVTPLFCAGADVNGRAELRLPSFKGVLRYWWRALAWSRLGGDLGKIQRHEDELFGSASGGQSRVLMRLASGPEPRAVAIGQVLTVSADSSRPVGEGARYLGYGVMEAFASGNKGTEAGQLTRACLRAPLDFTVQLRCRDLDDVVITSLVDALKAVGMLGGMGAKSRKGYGSLVLRSLQVDSRERCSAPESIQQLRDAILTLRNQREGLPEFTALSRGTRHVLVTSAKKEPLQLLDLVGREMVRFRSWGHNGKVLGGDSEKNFKDDHDLMKSHNRRSRHNRRSHPRRVAFGLPHNYGKHPNQQVGPSDSGLDRRASPLFIHIHECGTTPVAILSFLPARFLPQSRSGISVGHSEVQQAAEGTLYQPVHDFLDRLLDLTQRREPFANAVEVRP